MRALLIYLKLFALLAFVRAQAEITERSVSTSIVTLIELVDKEESLMRILTNYAEALQHKLNVINDGLAMLQPEQQKAQADKEAYVSNPLNSFSLVRRLSNDWTYWENFVQSNVDKNFAGLIENERMNVPTHAELTEAVNAITRLQQTYGLKESAMAAGILNGRQYDAKLTAIDLYAIGWESFEQRSFYQAGFWFYTALQTYEPNRVLLNVMQFTKLQIFEMYAECFVKQDKTKQALDTIESALFEFPNNANLLLKKIDILRKQNTVNTPLDFPPMQTGDYEHGCRGQFEKSTSSKLVCRYNSSTTAFLKLAPLKVEQIYEEPFMLLFHDVISDSEIAQIKKMARNQLKRATVYSQEKKKSVAATGRTSQFAWFTDRANELTLRINRRIVDMTGFDLMGSEQLQAMNYGLGGHYNTHYDFFNVSENDPVVRTNGDRIATVLFYLSDVEDGGATVFPNIRIAVQPRKGSAVMWYNLDNRMEGNANTMHAACPVIVGSKWVLNKWIREKSQMFIKPCYKE